MEHRGVLSQPIAGRQDAAQEDGVGVAFEWLRTGGKVLFRDAGSLLALVPENSVRLGGGKGELACTCISREG